MDIVGTGKVWSALYKRCRFKRFLALSLLEDRIIGAVVKDVANLGTQNSNMMATLIPGVMKGCTVG